MLLRELIERNARTYGDQPAYVDGDRVRTWAQMHQRSDRLAAALQQRGVKAGDSAAVLSQDRLEVLEHWFACVKIGAVRVGVNFRYSPTEVAHVLADAGVRCVLVEAACLPLLTDARQRLSDDRALVVGFGGEHGLPDDLETLCADSDSDYLPADPADGDPAAYAYTAGSTGLPKGVVWTHGGLREGMKWLAINVGLRQEDRWLSALPAAAGPLIFVSMNLVNGMTTVLPGGRFEPRRYLDLIAEHGITASMLVPTMLQDVTVELSRVPSDVSTLRLLAYGSMAATPSAIRTARDSFGCEVQQWYGSTEMTGIAAILRDADHVAALDGQVEVLGSCGRPMLHFDVEVRLEDGTAAATGAVGEIWVRGDTLASGYLNRPEETAESFVDGWFRPGDIGRLDSAGRLYVLDRKSFMIITGGYNVYPAVVEAALAEHPAVRETIVVGAPHPHWGEAVAAVVTLHAGATLDPTELIEFSRSRLAKWEVPKHVEVVGGLPRGATGKLDRRRVRDGLRAEPARLAWGAS